MRAGQALIALRPSDRLSRRYHKRFRFRRWLRFGIWFRILYLLAEMIFIRVEWAAMVIAPNFPAVITNINFSPIKFAGKNLGKIPLCSVGAMKTIITVIFFSRVRIEAADAYQPTAFLKEAKQCPPIIITHNALSPAGQKCQYAAADSLAVP